MINKVGSAEIVNFMTLGAEVLGCDHINHIVRMHNFFSNLFYSRAKIRQTEYILMIG